jgi:nucleoside-diphosphate-sugar epimerase/predicted dehydrogenase
MTRTPTRPLRVGLVGAGFIADWHANALRSVDGAELVAVCDRSRARARSFADRYGLCSVFDDVDTLLEQASLDSVHVLVPPEQHLSVARQAVEAGVATLLEKPMGLDAESCDALAQRAETRGVVLGVSHNFLFARPYERLRADLRAGRLGPVDRVTITWNRDLPPVVHGPFDAWMLREPANILLEVGVHSVAHMLDLIGAPEALGVTPDRPIKLPIAGTFYRRWHVRASHGRTAIDLHFSFSPGFDEHFIHVRGLLGAATADIANDVYDLQQPTGRSLDFDRYERQRRRARELKRQARRTLSAYAFDKLKLVRAGNPFASSIARAVQAFYQRVAASDVSGGDARVGAEFGREVVAQACRIAAAAGVDFGDRRETRPSVQVGRGLKHDILVLGGTGFIGRELVRELLKRGRPVRLLVRSLGRAAFWPDTSNLELVQGDARSREDLSRALEGVSFVQHLAKTDGRSLEDYLESDVKPTEQLADLCLELRVRRLVYTGTIDSFYLGPGAGTVTEETPLDPKISRRNSYARSKALAEAALTRLHRERGLPVVVLRPAIVIGRGGDPRHWGIGFWDGLGVCRFWGRGEHPLPLVLVEDVVAALIAAMDSDGIEGRSYNLSATPSLSARQYVREIERYAGIEIQARATSPWRFFAADLAKWAPKVLVRHPDAERVPSLRDWRCRSQHAVFDQAAAMRDLDWKPTNDPQEIVRRGIHAVLDEMLQ